MSPRTNDVLARLPDKEFHEILPHLEAVNLVKGQDLFQVGDLPDYQYYPAGAVVSVMKDMADGFSVETYMLGKASMVGHGAFYGPSFYRANVRSGGLAYRIRSSTLHRLLPDCPTLMYASMQALMRAIAQLSQAIVCGKHHSVEKQLMRWMLVTLDRNFGPLIEMTHQEISERLGFRREAITLALGKMVERGHVHIRRGSIEVIHRQALEAQVCDCYWIAQEKTKPDFQSYWDQASRLSAWRKGHSAGA